MISYDEFLRLLEDPDTSIETLREYVIAAPDSLGGFNPEVMPDPEKVDMPRFENAMAIGNGWSRNRRRKRFLREERRGFTKPVLVSEGDSWFQFPILIRDVIDHLQSDYHVWSLGAAGDTAENIIHTAPEYLKELRAKKDVVDAFLLSAAGNDIIGQDENKQPMLANLLHRYKPGQTADKQVNKAAMQRVLDTLAGRYSDLMAAIRGEPGLETLPVFIHGYDYAFAYPASTNDRRRPAWAKRDQWLGSAFELRGIPTGRLRNDIIKYLIDNLYDMMFDLAADDPNLHVVNVRETLTSVTDWADEIHGTDNGFFRVAKKFKKDISKAINSTRHHESRDTQTNMRTMLDVGLDELSIRRHSSVTAEARWMGFGNTDTFAHGFRRQVNFEAVIGADESVPFWYLTEGAMRGRAVAKIEAQGTSHTGQSGTWEGTGFLIAPNILLTNAHVINSRTVASASRVLFDYATKPDGGAESPVTYRLNPSRLFLLSDPYDLDYCFVWLDGDAHERFATIPFWRGNFIGAPNTNANIIHHPSGQPKKASLKENKVRTGLGAEDTLIHYLTDTLPGSSGAPVMDDEWRLFALHHASTRVANLDASARSGLTEDGDFVVNEGIRTSSIAADVELRSRGGEDVQSAREILRALHGIDSRTGFFGTLGRATNGHTGFERVVNSVRGAPEDVDVAFWNIEWFNRDVDEKIGDVVRVIADLNLDIWALEEVSPSATERLVDRLNRDFGQSFDFAASEPGASDGKQSTTVIWNTLTVRGERLEWPESAHEILRLDSRDPDAAQFEAVEGKLFNRYPGLFRFEALNRDGGAFDFNLVPLHLKARSEGAKRRRMASNALARAVQIAVAEDPSERDWIIGGDLNAELSTGQFQGLTDAGFTALSAADEEDGAFTYLKNPFRTLIDSIFVSPGVMPKVEADDFLIVAADREYADFVNRVSDHRPVMVRLSLSDGTEVAQKSRSSMGTKSEDNADLFRRFLEMFQSDPEGSLRTLAKLVD